MAALEEFHDAAIGTINAAWRAVASRLPACTRNSRKDCWSKEYGEQARRYRALAGAHSLWIRGGASSKHFLLEKLECIGRISGWEHMVKPTMSDRHWVWELWVVQA